MNKTKKWMMLIGQMIMMLVAVVLGGPAAMAASIEVTNTPEAEVTNPTNTTTTENGGAAVFPEQSVTTGQEAAPEVYEDQYDKLITEIRRARTPLDQISRRSRRKSKAKSMEFHYASIDYLPTETVLSAAFAPAVSFTQDYAEVQLTCDNAGIFNPRDTILVQGVQGYEADGLTVSVRELVLWVVDRTGNQKITVIATNGKKVGNFKGQVPALEKGVTLQRMGKACGEMDAQAPGYAIFPTSDEQYCQKFMAQVEQSTIDALTAKRYDITLNDQEEATLADMRLGMEKSFLFSVMSKFVDPQTRRNVWTTGGIWNMPSKQIDYTDPAAWAPAKFIDMSREMFTGPAAGRSDRRVVLCGSKLLAYMQNGLLEGQYSTNVYKKWDIEFTEVRTVFGAFELVLDEVFDLVGMSENGLIIDPDYLERYTLRPFGRTTLDLDKQGVRDSKAIVLSEISSLVLKSPNNHARIVRR